MKIDVIAFANEFALIKKSPVYFVENYVTIHGKRVVLTEQQKIEINNAVFYREMVETVMGYREKNIAQPRMFKKNEPGYCKNCDYLRKLDESICPNCNQ